MWYPHHPPHPQQYHPGPYDMYHDHPPYEWPPMRAPPMRAPPMRAPRAAMYTEEPRDDVEESAEVAVARGFAALVGDMTLAMGHNLARFPVDRRIVPFGGLASNKPETAAVRGSAPSATPFSIEIPVSVETALTGQIKFVEWMQTQCATNVHHAHHAAFNAALGMVRAEARYTRLMYRQTGGTGSVYDDPELQPVSDRASALVAYEHLKAYLDAEGANGANPEKSAYQKAGKHLLHTEISNLMKKWRDGK